MKKSLLLVLIALLIILAVYIALNGFAIGNVEVLSYKGIQERNAKLDDTIQQASKLAEKDFKNMINDVEQNTKKLINEKKEYEDMALVNGEDSKAAGQIQKYKVETLWVKLGTYATTEGTVLQMDIKNSSSSGEGRYDLSFTVNGSYIAITDFISDIENDSMLGFKIEEFKIRQDSSDTDLVATFVCKNIAILDVQATTNSASQSDSNQNSTNTNNTNTNSTNTNNTNNTNTNSTNTNNTNTNSTNTTENTTNT